MRTNEQLAELLLNSLSSQEDPYDFTDRYNTELSPEEELEFRDWAEKNNRTNDIYDYDIKGAWKEIKAGTMTEDERHHLGDKYKKPNHPTFSNQSIYNNIDGYIGGEWQQDKKGNYTFKAGPSNTFSKEALKKYFQERERGVKLIDRR